MTGNTEHAAAEPSAAAALNPSKTSSPVPPAGHGMPIFGPKELDGPHPSSGMTFGRGGLIPTDAVRRILALIEERLVVLAKEAGSLVVSPDVSSISDLTRLAAGLAPYTEEAQHLYYMRTFLYEHVAGTLNVTLPVSLPRLSD